MKAISFSVVEILPALLDKSKTQTIRKAWIEVKSIEEFNNLVKQGFMQKVLYDEPIKTVVGELLDKPARFEVGDNARLYWKRNSIFDWFCKNPDCYNFGNFSNPFPWSVNTGTNEVEMMAHCCKEFMFQKILGEVEITEVFKIEMGIKIGKYIRIGGSGINLSDPQSLELAMLDGFKNSVKMFDWFDKQYDLSIPKEFWTYRWKYLKSQGGD